jgi:Domain of unknown function (DUF4214)
MLFLHEIAHSIRPRRRTAGGDTRRPVRSTPQVVPLEGRALLSGGAVGPGTVAARPTLTAEVRTDRAMVRTLYHNLLGTPPKPATVARWVQALEAGMTRKQVKAEIMASPAYRRLHPAVAGVGANGLSADGGGGNGVVGAYSGGGTMPDGYLSGFPPGIQVLGSYPGTIQVLGE